MKILVLGHGRHGKDTVAEYLHEKAGLTFNSSSMFCAEKFIYDALKERFGYKTIIECYAGRHSHRELWKSLISGYNKDDKARLAREILKEDFVYVGMRCQEEYEAALRENLFDLILWVDASERVTYVDPTLDIEYDPRRMVLINNNGPTEDLELQLDLLIARIKICEEPIYYYNNDVYNGTTT